MSMFPRHEDFMMHSTARFEPVPDLEQRLKKLPDLVKKNIGKPVLVVEQEWKYTSLGSGGCFGGGGGFGSLHEQLTMAIVDGPLKGKKNQDRIIPTSKYARWSEFSHRGDEWTLKEGDLKLPFVTVGSAVSMLLYQKDIKADNPLGPNTDLDAINLLFGDDVERYFRTDQRMFWKHYHALLDGKDTEQEYVNAVEKTKKLDPRYHGALALLGLPLPKDVQEQNEKRLDQLSEAFVAHVLDSNYHVRALQTEVNRIKNLAENDHPFVDNFVACMMTLNDRKEIQDIKIGLERNLHNAVKEGLHRRPYTSRAAGVVVDVPSTVRDLCKAYKIELKD
jgi:hypothetical protein